uniref:Uncharacterized protein n=1 Tax=Arundo donax TaxID=35708 RepID=A0A0A8YPT8_ARUDO
MMKTKKKLKHPTGLISETNPGHTHPPGYITR